jgi:SAM-dependent methyltransferase
MRPAYHPTPGENKMTGAGDVWTARTRYFAQPSANLKLVVANRYEWMNRFIEGAWRGVEVGCGAGLSRGFIRSRQLLLTDYADYDWLDVKNVNALETPFEDGSFDFALSVNVIHHLAHPLRFFTEMSRILRPGGRLIVQDVRCSSFLRLALRLQRHEGYDYNVDVFDPQAICTDPDDQWAGNNAIVDLLLEDRPRFFRAIPQFKLIHESYSEFLTLLNSGGVVAKTAYVPLPMPLMNIVDRVDRALTQKFPQAFACQVQLVFEKQLGS